MTRYFYESARALDRLREVALPSKTDLDRLRNLISADDDLSVYFYADNRNEKWVALLKEAGEFEGLEGGPEEVGLKERVQAAYLAKVAEKEPERVLDVIGSIEANDAYIKGQFLEALLKMPVDYSVRAASVVLKYLAGRTAGEWYLVGKRCAQFMERLADRYENEAFAVAKELLKVWMPDDSEKNIFNDIAAQFATYEYQDIVFRHYRKVCEAYPFRGAKVLVEIFDEYLTELNERKGFDVSEHFYITVENLDAIGRVDRDYITILVKAICDAGRVVIEKQPGSVDELLTLLRATGNAIFTRVEMYLLRFVAKGVQNERIIEILLNRRLFEAPGFRHEYDLLLRDKIAEVRGAVEDTYKKRIEEIAVRDKEDFARWFRETRERDVTEEDLAKYESRMRAARIYLVREQFPELYARYKDEAGSTDEQLAPTPRISVGDGAVAEESPIPIEELLNREPGDVLDYLLDPANYRGKRKPGMWHDPEESLRYVFGEVVRQRMPTYVDQSLNGKLIKLDSTFLGTYLNRVMAGVKEKDVGGAFWAPWLELAELIVKRATDKSEYRACLSDILWTIQEGLGDRYHIESDIKNVEVLWQILKALVRYGERTEDSAAGSPPNEDPLQTLCRSVAGKALEQVVSFAIACKKRQKDYYEEHLQAEVRAVLDYVVSEVKRPEVNCAFGSEFARIYWLDEEWLGNNLDKIFEGDMWDVVWGTYMSWGPARPDTFRLLANTSRYRHAVDLIGTPNKYKFEKDPQEGLAEHLMIALFNGWFIGRCNDELLLQFLKKAPAKLRGHAAEFLTTGFESLKEEKANHGIANRLRAYWEGRLAAMSGRAKEDFDEGVAFISWAKNSPIEPADTLRLLSETLDLTGGKLGRQGYEFVNAVCTMGKGNELAAVRCLNKAMGDDEIAMYFTLYEEELTEFMESIVGLGDDYPNVAQIRKEAMQLADAYGRKHVDVGKFRRFFEMLRLKVGAI